MKQTHTYKIDLTKISGAGDFSCPGCENKISPDDENEETYSILRPKVDSRGLKELVICCNSCLSYIRLTGFSLLQKV